MGSICFHMCLYYRFGSRCIDVLALLVRPGMLRILVDLKMFDLSASVSQILQAIHFGEHRFLAGCQR